MPIEYYPDEQYKKQRHVAEKLQLSGTVLTDSGQGDLSPSVGFDHTLWYPGSMTVQDVNIHFSTTNNKSYAIDRVIGRGIVTNANDRLWLKTPGYPAQKIVLTQGFYDGDTLSTELESQLNGNAAFDAAGLTPFTVSYDGSTGLFTITPSAGAIQFFAINTTVPVRRRSTAGPVLGFTANTSAEASLTSDTAVGGLGTATQILAETDTATVDLVSTDLWVFNVDESLLIHVDSLPGETVVYNIAYTPVI